MKINNHEEARTLWLEYANGDLADDQSQALEAYLDQHPELKSEFDQNDLIWDNLEEAIEEHSEGMDEKFYAMLETHENEGQKSFSQNWLIAAAVSMLIMGFALGWFFNSPSQSSMVALTSQVNQMQEMMMLTLIEQPKAQDRLKAVNISLELSSADNTVINALVKTLQMDENTNVRLAALEALAAKANYPEARQALIESIAYQENPLVQIAIAELMVEIEARDAKPELESLLERPDLIPVVKEKITQSLQSI
ncbi:MAG: HEAT repeat domain-containing protein [Bacteroidota bacterium]